MAANVYLFCKNDHKTDLILYVHTSLEKTIVGVKLRHHKVFTKECDVTPPSSSLYEEIKNLGGWEDAKSDALVDYIRNCILEASKQLSQFKNLYKEALQ